MSRRRKILVGVAVAALIAVMVIQALRAGRSDAVTVRGEVVGRRDLVSRVTATGHIEPKSSVDISADISGRIVTLPVEEGQDVVEGDLLLEIDPTQYEANLRAARARLSEARARESRTRADYMQAGREWDRLRELKERTPDLVTDQEAEQARTRAEVAEAEWRAARHAVEQAEASVAEAEDRLAKTVIRSPMDGRVTRLNVEKGETAVVGTMNNPGSLLLTVADLSVMEAVVEVDETEIPRVSIGDSAAVEIDAFPDTAFAGRVTKIGNSSVRPRGATAGAQDQAVDFEVRITLDDPPEGIRPDLSATADVVTARRDGVLAIPIIALTLQDTAQLGDGWRERLPGGVRVVEELEGVFVARGAVARFQPIRVGVTGDDEFEVLAGLTAGDTVVSGTYQAIRDLEDGRALEFSRIEGVGSEGGQRTRTPRGDRGAGGEDGD